MKEFKVVIGSNFGDEGKGLMTDYFASRAKNGIVVRFNGGAQAGHTVRMPDGRRHVFGHFGSGSFASLPTYLSSSFVVNPMTFVHEFETIEQLSLNPTLYIDRSCIVTTPYDMIINQMVETVRGNARHGSCGLGFNETITRSLSDSEFNITVNDLYNESRLRQKLHNIRTKYNPRRIADLGITTIPEAYGNLLENDGITEGFIDDVNYYMLGIIGVTDVRILNKFDTVIFEGAQGLLLDQNYEYFPHVTRSNTGMKNVADILSRIAYDNEEVEITYVTRSYMTRHGAGPFPTELSEKPYAKIVDMTNIPNQYQGTLRFGLLDLDELGKTIRNDLRHANGRGRLNCKATLALTCLDQIDDTAKYILNKTIKEASVEDFIKDVFTTTGFGGGYLSFGDTRQTIRTY